MVTSPQMRGFQLRTVATTRLFKTLSYASLAMIVDARADVLAHVGMTPDEADQHIIKSRRFLADWIAVGAGSEIEDVLKMVSEEILILEALAEEYPGKVDRVIALAMEWIEFQKRLKKQLN